MYKITSIERIGDETCKTFVLVAAMPNEIDMHVKGMQERVQEVLDVTMIATAGKGEKWPPHMDLSKPPRRSKRVEKNT